GLALSPFEWSSTSSQFDLVLSVDTEVFREVRLLYDSDVFVRATAQRMLDGFLGLIDQTLADPSRKASEYSCVSAPERALLALWNATEAPFAREARVDQVLAESLMRHRERCALRSASASVSCAELQ